MIDSPSNDPLLIQVSNPLNGSALAFPALECIHILGFTACIGSIAIVDFRLLGLGLRGQSPAELAKALMPWNLIGLVIAIMAGFGLYSSDPDMYYLNWSFL